MAKQSLILRKGFFGGARIWLIFAILEKEFLMIIYEKVDAEGNIISYSKIHIIIHFLVNFHQNILSKIKKNNEIDAN